MKRRATSICAGPTASGKRPACHFLPGTLRASSLSDAKGLRASISISWIWAARSFTVAALQFHMRRDPDGSDLDLMLGTDALKLEGVKQGNLQLYITLSQLDALLPLLRGETSWPQAVQRWRAQGGKAKLSNGLLAGLSPVWRQSPLY